MFNKGQLAGLMKQAQAMQQNVQRVQDEIAQSEVSGEAASGQVKIVMSGKHEVKRVHIAEALIADEGDREMLEDLMLTAFNAAWRAAEKLSEDKLGAVKSGMPGLPAGMKLPF